MTVSVVYLLEPIEIEEEDHQPSGRIRDLGQPGHELLEEVGSVGQPSQGIVGCLVFELIMNIL